jgi:hypothetical protein
MSDTPQKPLQKIRTFAQDVKAQQATSGTVIPSTLTLPTEVAKKPADTSVQLPAFHELKRSAPTPLVATQTAHSTKEIQKGPTITVEQTPTTPTPPQPSPKKIHVRAKKRPARQPLASGDATIITDTKKSEIQFVPSLLQSIDRWFIDLKRSFKKKQAPKYTVAEAERRKGVIQKATTSSGALFTADNETLKEEIRRRQSNIPSIHRTVTWSPNTETGYTLLANPTATSTPTPIRQESVRVHFKKQSLPQPVFTEPSVPNPLPVPSPLPSVTPVTPVPQATSTQWESEKTDSVTPVPEKATIPTPTKTPAEKEEVTIPEETEEEYSTPDETDEEFFEEEKELEDEELEYPEQQYATPEARRAITSVRSFRDVLQVNTTALSVGVAGVVGVIVIFIVGIKILLGIFTPDAVPSIPNTPAAPIISGAAVTEVTLLTPSVEAIRTALAEHDQVQAGVTELRLLENTQPLPVKTTLALLGFDTNQTLSRSITDVHLAHINTQRALVFKVSDATAVFGSLLSWEKTMVDDIGWYFKINNLEEGAVFTDRTLGQTDVRILQLGDEQLLVYGFINQNTLLITEEVGAFSTALGAQ